MVSHSLFWIWDNIGTEDGIGVGETATYWATVFIFEKSQRSGIASLNWDSRGQNTLELKIDHGRMHVRSQGIKRDCPWIGPCRDNPERNSDSPGDDNGSASYN